MPQHYTSRTSARTLDTVRDYVVCAAGGYKMHWVMIHEIGEALGLDREVVFAAVKDGIDRGWFVPDSDPPSSIKLSAVFIEQAA
jgi:hypothetical protein